MPIRYLCQHEFFTRVTRLTRSRKRELLGALPGRPLGTASLLLRLGWDSMCRRRAQRPFGTRFNRQRIRRKRPRIRRESRSVGARRRSSRRRSWRLAACIDEGE